MPSASIGPRRSTNLVLALGMILFLLLGWEFVAAEWIGGLVLIVIMSVLVKLTWPKRLVEETGVHREEGRGHEHRSAAVDGETWRGRLADPQARIKVAQNFAIEWRTLGKELAARFLIGGFPFGLRARQRLAGAVPRPRLAHASPAVRTVANLLTGPIVAMLTVVCRIGNVPLAAIPWSGGASFGGVIAVLYANPIVLPLLDVCRRYLGWRMMAYMAAIFFVTMTAAAPAVDLGFQVTGSVPYRAMDIRARMTEFSVNHTFWLNPVALTLAAYLFVQNRRHPMDRGAHHRTEATKLHEPGRHPSPSPARDDGGVHRHPPPVRHRNGDPARDPVSPRGSRDASPTGSSAGPRCRAGSSTSPRRWSAS